MGSSRAAKRRRKTVHTKEQVGLRRKRKPPQAVQLPGTTEHSSWLEDTTLNRNYRALGLASDPNAGFGRVNPVVRPAAQVEAVVGPKLADLAVTDADAMRECTGKPLAKGHRAPRRLTAKQLVRRPTVASCELPLTRRCRASWAPWWRHTGTMLRR